MFYSVLFTLKCRYAPKPFVILVSVLGKRVKAYVKGTTPLCEYESPPARHHGLKGHGLLCEYKSPPTPGPQIRTGNRDQSTSCMWTRSPTIQIPWKRKLLPTIQIPEKVTDKMPCSKKRVFNKWIPDLERAVGHLGKLWVARKNTEAG
jgi:hypothetical protein